MNPTGDYPDEMPPTLTESAVEAFLNGEPHPGWEGVPALVALADSIDHALGGAAPRADLARLGEFLTPAIPPVAGAVPEPQPLAPVVPLPGPWSSPRPTPAAARGRGPPPSPGRGG